ncbi:MAG: hypothetical protein ACRCUT_01250, partial [Spirochaetota bacterium]
MKKPLIRAIICSCADRELPLSCAIISAFPEAEHFFFENDVQRGGFLDSCMSKGYDSKQVILLDRFRGRLVQKCPATKGMICCNYRLVNT